MPGNFLDAALNSFTQTTASYVQPAIGATVLVRLASTSWIPLGLSVFLETGGTYAVTQIIDAQRVVLQRAASGVGASTGATVPLGVRFSAAGSPGADGEPGKGIASVRAVQTAPLTGWVYDNAAGTWTAPANGALPSPWPAFDSVSTPATSDVGYEINDDTGVTGGTTGARKGIAVLTSVGSGGSKAVLTRRADLTTPADFVGGVAYDVLDGATKKATRRQLLTQGAVVLGTTTLSFGPVRPANPLVTDVTLPQYGVVAIDSKAAVTSIADCADAVNLAIYNRWVATGGVVGVTPGRGAVQLPDGNLLAQKPLLVRSGIRLFASRNANVCGGLRYGGPQCIVGNINPIDIAATGIDSVTGSQSLKMYDASSYLKDPILNLTADSGVFFNAMPAFDFSFIAQFVNLTDPHMISTRGRLSPSDNLQTCFQVYPQADGSVRAILRAWHSTKAKGYGTSPPVLTLSGAAIPADCQLRIEPISTGPRGTWRYRVSANDGAGWLVTNVLSAASTTLTVGRLNGVTLNWANTSLSTFSQSGTPTLTFSGNTIVRSGGSWITDGFAIGDKIKVTGATTSNGWTRVTNISALTLTVSGLPYSAEVTSGATVSSFNCYWTNWESLSMTTAASKVTTAGSPAPVYQIATTFDGTTARLYVSTAGSAYDTPITATTSLTGAVVQQMPFEETIFGAGVNGCYGESQLLDKACHFILGSAACYDTIQTRAGTTPATVPLNFGARFYFRPCATAGAAPTEQLGPDGLVWGWDALAGGGLHTWVISRRAQNDAFSERVSVDNITFDAQGANRSGLLIDAPIKLSRFENLTFDGGSHGFRQHANGYGNTVANVHAQCTICDASFVNCEVPLQGNNYFEGSGINYFESSAGGTGAGTIWCSPGGNAYAGFISVGCTGRSRLKLVADTEGGGGFAYAACSVSVVTGAAVCVEGTLSAGGTLTPIMVDTNNGLFRGQLTLDCSFAPDANNPAAIVIKDPFVTPVRMGPNAPSAGSLLCPLSGAPGYVIPYGGRALPITLADADATLTSTGTVNSYVMPLATGRTLRLAGLAQLSEFRIVVQAVASSALTIVDDASGATIDTIAVGVRGTFVYQSNGTAYALAG